MKHYTALTCTTDRETLDLIAALSGRFPITGLLEEEGSVTLYFDEEGYNDTIPDRLRSWLPEDAAVAFSLGSVEEQNWNAEFEQSLQPLQVSDDLIITQSWNPVSPPSDRALVIRIDPKMSFGTGHHESTRLIARLMMKHDPQGKRFLDVGTGTGVLAIAAALKGAAHVTAFDNNEWAVENTRENLELNGLTESSVINVVQGELQDIAERDFDIILANLHRNLITELLPDLINRMHSPETSLLLTSGVLIEDYHYLVEAAAEHGLKPVDEERENEWVATTWGR